MWPNTTLLSLLAAGGDDFEQTARWQNPSITGVWTTGRSFAAVNLSASGPETTKSSRGMILGSLFRNGPGDTPVRMRRLGLSDHDA
jgi:hypothetical protein